MRFKNKTFKIIAITFSASLLILLTFLILALSGVFNEGASSNYITIESLSLSKEYDGTPLTYHEYKIDSGSLNNSDSLEVTFLSEITNVGETDNLFTIQIKSSFGTDVTKNYEVNFIYGKLNVTPRRVLLKTKDCEKYYDGTPLVCHEYEEILNLATGEEPQVEFIGSQLNSGSSENEATLKIFKENIDVTSNYDISYDFGLLHVLGHSLKIETKSISKVYDGIVLSSSDFDILEGSLIEGDEISYSGGSEILNVGTVSNTGNFIILNSEGLDVTASYELDITYGTLTITKRKITIRSKDYTKEYLDDFDILEYPYYDILNRYDVDYSDYLLTGDEVKVIYFNSIKKEDALDGYKIASNILEYQIINSEGLDVTSNYDINKIYGTLTIENNDLSQLTIYILPKNKYVSADDGLDFIVADDYIANNKSLLEQGYTFNVTYGGMQQGIGTSKSYIDTVQIFDKYGVDKTNNFKIVKREGILQIYEFEITLEAPKKEKAFDGEILTTTESEWKVEGLKDGYTYKLQDFSQIVNVGSIDNSCNIRIFNENLEDVTENIKVNMIKTELKINRETLIFETASKTSSLSDGGTLDCHEYIIYKMVDGQKVLFSFSSDFRIEIDGWQIQNGVGKSENTFTSFEIYYKDTLVTSEYIINFNYGLLEITN